MNLIDKQDSHP